MDPDADPDPAIFVNDLQDKKKKFLKFCCLLLFKGVLTSFFKDKSHKEVTKQVESMFFLLFLLCDRRNRSRIHISD
jgi:hypothetical protein